MMKTVRFYIIPLILLSAIILSLDSIVTEGEILKQNDVVTTVDTEIVSDIDAAVRHFNESKKTCFTSSNNVSLSSPNTRVPVRRKDNNESAASCQNLAGVLHHRYFNHSSLPYLFQTEFLRSRVHLILLKKLII